MSPGSEGLSSAELIPISAPDWMESVCNPSRLPPFSGPPEAAPDHLCHQTCPSLPTVTLRLGPPVAPNSEAQEGADRLFQTGVFLHERGQRRPVRIVPANELSS